MDTARGAVPSVSQTARGAPPLRGPPSVSARMRLAPGIHACATATLPGKGLDLGVRDFPHLLTPVAAISPEGVGRQGKIRAENHRNEQGGPTPRFRRASPWMTSCPADRFTGTSRYADLLQTCPVSQPGRGT